MFDFQNLVIFVKIGHFRSLRYIELVFKLVIKLVIWSVEKVGNERLPELGQDIQVPEHGRVPFNRFFIVSHD